MMATHFFALSVLRTFFSTRYLLRLCFMLGFMAMSFSGSSQGDSCSNALLISNVVNYCSSPGQYTNAGTTATALSPLPSCWTGAGANAPTQDVWFRFTAIATDVLISVNGSGAGGTMVRPRIALYLNSGCSSLTIAGSNSCANGTAGSGVTQLYQGGLTPGLSYLICISSTTANAGSFELCVNNYQPPTSATADCGGAGKLCNKNAISVGGLSGGGTNNNENAGTCMGGFLITETNSIWYTWSCQNAGTLTFDILPANPTNDIDFVLFQLGTTNPCGPRNVIRCSAASCLNANGSTGLSMSSTDTNEPLACPPTSDAYVQFVNMTAGTSYALLINNANTSQGFTLQWGGTGTFVGPQAQIAVASPTVCAGNPVVFNGSASTSYTALAWNFTDGNGNPVSATGPGPHSVLYANPGIYTAILQASGAPNCTSVNAVTVNITPPTASPTVTSVSYCQNAPAAALTATGSNLQWYAGASGGTGTATAPVPSTSAAGVTTYYVTQTLNGCESPRAAINVTVHPNPTVTASSNSPLCAGGSASLTASAGAAGYSWAGSNGFSSTQQNPVNGPLTAGTITYTVTGSNAGCSATATISVVVNPMPSATASAQNPTLCAGQTLSLTASGGGSYAWTGSNGFSSSVQSPTLSTASGQVTFTCQVSLNSCSSSATLSTQTYAVPVPALSTNAPVCEGTTLSFTATGGSAYAWSGPMGFSSSSGTPSIPNVQPGAGGDYTVQVSNGNCNATATITANVFSVSSATASSSGTICAGSTLTLSTIDAGQGGSYAWSGPGFNAAVRSPVIANATTSNSGVYSVTVTSVAGCSVSASVQAQVNAVPTLTAGSNSPLCEGATLQLSAAGATSYSWSGPSFSSTQQNPSINAVPVSGGGTYTVTGTTAGCPTTQTLSVIVNALPIATANANGPLCAGQTLLLTSSGGTSYSWSGPRTSSVQNPTVSAVTTADGGVYTVTVTANNCSATASVQVQVNPVPAATASVQNSPLCTGQTLSLTASGGGSYSWTGSDGFASAQQNPTYTPAAGPVTFTCQVTLNNCIGTATTNAQINPTPLLQLNTNAPVCEGQALSLTAGGATSYTWSGPSGFTDQTSAPTINPSAVSNSGTYTVTGTTQGCSATATIQAQVNPLPAATASALNSPLCAGQTLSLSATGGGSYSWTGSDGFTSGQQNPTYTPGVGPVTFTCQVTLNSCIATATTNAQINATPQLQLNTNAPVCEGQALNLMASGATSYTWSGPSGFTDYTSAPTINPSSVSNSGTYTVTGSAQGCSATATIQAQVVQLAGITINATQPVCEGSNLQLGATGGNSYSWSGPGAFQSSQQNPYINPVSISNAGVYTVTVQTAGCSQTRTIQVSVDPLPVATFTALERAGCMEFCTAFSASVTPPTAAVNWNFGNGATSTLQNPGQICYPASGSYDVMLQLSTATCSNTIAQAGYITVYANPIADFTWSPLSPTSLSDNNVDFTDLSTGSVQSWSWNFGDPTGNDNTSVLQDPSHVYNNSDVYPVKLQVSNAHGCTDEIVKKVKVMEEVAVYIPNAFSPGNGDGINDVFLVHGTGLLTENYEMRIYDRWGALVFRTDDIYKGWDGTIRGTKAKQDVYVYKILVRDVKQKDRIYTGHVTLLQ